MRLQVIDLVNPLWLQTLQKLRHDIYHLPEYLSLEAKRAKATPEAIMIVDDEKIFFLPYLLRKCSDIFDGELLRQEEVFDIVSPYGYPGILLSEAASSTPEFLDLAMNHLMYVLHNKQICSAFLRLHPILNYDLNKTWKPKICKVIGETVSINLRLSEAEIWNQTRPRERSKINKCKRNGMIAKMVPFQQYVDEFVSIYEETMERVKASGFYYFASDYFLQFASVLGEKVYLCIVEFEEQVACAGLFTECCGIVQFHLGGTRNKFLKQEPSKLMIDYVRFWAKERGNEVFHLGGGVGGNKDSLYHFKTGFSKQRHTFLTLQLITDLDKYNHLVKLRAKALNTETNRLLNANFFPAYRCSSVANN